MSEQWWRPGGDESGRERPEQAEWYEYEQHAGNGTVNHGPESSYDGPDTPRDGSDMSYEGELGSDELALRRMLQQAVQDIEPTDGALDHLRHAVPARRARKRQAVVGMAAAALFVGTAIPALIHVSNSAGSPDTTSVASSRDSQGQGDGASPDGSKKSDDSGSGASKSQGKGSKGKNDQDKGTTGSATGSSDPASTAAASSPACGANELGSPTQSVGSTEADGKVYGSFTITNISSAACTIEGAGTVSFTAQGAADSTKISIVDHTAGDGSGLPDPSLEASPLVLAPGKSYQVRFAWAPSATCPTTTSTGGSGEPSPDPSPSQDSTTTGGTGGTSEQSGTTTQLVAEDGGTADGSVLLTLTAEPGSPVVSATIPNACAGTIYKTGVLAAE
ncbi:hypothetical protein ACWD4J_15270 [Streptomyces sp. NPDC002577]